MSKPVQTNQHPQPCSLQRADQFLNSSDYRIEDIELITHLETCDQCREYMDTQAATPEMWGNLSTLLKPGEFDEAGTPDFSAATIGHIGQKPVAAQDVLDALSHATCRGGLYLNGLETVTPEVVNALSHGTYMLSLQGLDKDQLDAETLKTIEVAQQITLNKLKVLLDAEMQNSKAAGTDGAKVSDIDDHKNIQGTWRLTYAEDSGRVVPQEQISEMAFVFTDKTMNTEIAGRKSEATYELRSSANPKLIELTENGVTKPGIYDLQGDTLRLCICQANNQRPTAFDTQPGSLAIVFIMKRVRPGDEKSATDTDNSSHSAR